MRALSAESLASISDTVAVPTYPRSPDNTSIVHFGVGGFHRAHMAMYLDRLMAEGKALDWAICGVGVLPSDSAMRDALHAQDHLYTLVLKFPDGRLEPRVIGSIQDYLFAPDDPEAVIERMAAERTRIVSLTVTEGGYHVHPVTGEFDDRDAGIQADLTPGATPTTTFGLITEALVRRRERGLAPFTVLSCDNIQGNGHVAQRMFTAFARLRDPELGAWMEAEVAFPNCMVDRITPVTADSDRATLAERFGIEDRWPVVCEPYTQWVLEDHFTQGRPPLEEVGTQLVEDVTPYELMKLRLLNAGHQVMCYLGYLAGYRYAHEAAADPAFVDLLMGYWEREGTPALQPVPGVDLVAYRHSLIERFANPAVADTLSRLCFGTSDRIPKFLVPVLRHQLDNGGEYSRSVLTIASWARYAEGVDEKGDPIDVQDQLREGLMANAARQGIDGLEFVRNRDLFGDLVDDERFVTEYRRALRSLHEQGAAATVAEWVRAG
ncbi:mannitol dehydrogenase family protein [Pseudonocardia spinosispora]|uniref:mannitol dehydrogenase family protein n=1 Tax=Pseudonocardia spinosispora TaxID=103441 RepID=UPI000407618E|nr:mannitol dehydrogenase family protein [Pseudonocardia spinosispora]